jgi:hypothetical protein
MHSPRRSVVRTFGFQRLVQASALALTFWLVKISLGDIAMNPRVAQQPAFIVVGIAARTKNAKEKTGRRHWKTVGALHARWGVGEDSE